MDYLTYAEALIEINRQYREKEIDFDLSIKLSDFCQELHNLWKESVKK